MRGDVHGFLAGGGIQHEQNFRRLHEVAQPHELLHERLVNLQTSGGVEDQNIAIVRFRKIQSLARNFQNVRFAALEKNRNFNLFAERLELVHRGGTINVRRHEQRLTALFLQQLREFAGRSRFAGAVQADQQNRAGIFVELQRGVLRAEEFDEFVGNNFDDLLAGLDAGDDFRAERFGFDALDKIARDLEIHVGFEQRHRSEEHTSELQSLTNLV